MLLYISVIKNFMTPYFSFQKNMTPSLFVTPRPKETPAPLAGFNYREVQVYNKSHKQEYDIINHLGFHSKWLCLFNVWSMHYWVPMQFGCVKHNYITCPDGLPITEVEYLSDIAIIILTKV